jgi:hypothetical protein
MKKGQVVIFIAFLSIFTLVLGGCDAAPNNPAAPDAGTEANNETTPINPAGATAGEQPKNDNSGKGNSTPTPPPDSGGKTGVNKFNDAIKNLQEAKDIVTKLQNSSSEPTLTVINKILEAIYDVEAADKEEKIVAVRDKLQEAVTRIGEAGIENAKIGDATASSKVGELLSKAKQTIQKEIGSLSSQILQENKKTNTGETGSKTSTSSQTESSISYVIIALSIISLIAIGGCIWLLFDSRKSISDLKKIMSADIGHNLNLIKPKISDLYDNIDFSKKSLIAIKEQVSTLSSARQPNFNNASQNTGESWENQNLRDELSRAERQIQSLEKENDTLVEGKNELERHIRSRESQIGQEAKDHVDREIAKNSAIIESLKQELEKATVSSISSERIPEIPVSPEILRRLIENLKSSPATQVSNVEGLSLNEKIATQTKQLETFYRSAMNGDTSAAKRLLEEIPLRPYEYSPELWSDSIAAKNKLEIARNLATKLLEKHGYKLIQPIPGVDAYSMQWHDERDQIITFDSRLIGKVAVVRTAGLEYGGEIIKKAFIAQYVQGTGTPPSSSVAPDYSRPLEPSPSATTTESTFGEASQPNNTVVNTGASGSSIENPSDTNRTSGIGATGESSSDTVNDSQQHKSTSAPNGQSAFPPSGHQFQYDTQKSDGEEPVQ